MYLFKRMAILSALLLALAFSFPVQAQTIRDTDDGTTLKQIIIFGRHSIRSSTANPASTLNQYAADLYPDFTGVPPGYLTPRGREAERLLGAYFRSYLLHERLLTGNNQLDLSRSYFRANSIQRSNITASKFGVGLIPGVTIPVHSYPIAKGNTLAVPDPVFDPLLAGVATVDPQRAVTEARGIFGSGAAIKTSYYGELSMLSRVFYPPGTKPLYPPGTLPSPDGPPGSIDATTIPFTIEASSPLPPGDPPYYTGNVIDFGGLNSVGTATDPFIMQYADGFPLDKVAWGRLTLNALSQQTRLPVQQINIAMRTPYLNQVQSSNAASHVLRTMEQAVVGVTVPGAFGNPKARAVVIISSDFYVAGLAGILQAHWLLHGYQPDFVGPGGALVFELRQVRSSGRYIVRVFFTGQTLKQLRYLTPLTLNKPPQTMQLMIPGGSKSTTDLDVNFETFQALVRKAIKAEYVQDPAKEKPPGVLKDVPLN